MPMQPIPKIDLIEIFSSIQGEGLLVAVARFLSVCPDVIWIAIIAILIFLKLLYAGLRNSPVAEK